MPYMKKKRGKRTYKKRRSTRKKSTSSLQRQITALRRALPRPEKKRLDTYADEELFGQVDGQNDGFFSADTTPNPAQGTGVDQRIGAQIKVTGIKYNMQIRQMSAATGNGKMIIELYRVPAQVWSTSATFVNTIFEANPFIRTSGGANAGVIDYNSQYDPDYFGQFKLLRRKRVSVRGDSLTSQVSIKTFTFGIKFKKAMTIKWNDNGVTPQFHQLILVVRADTGNMSSSTASTNTGIANTAVSTGYVLNYNHKTYFVDN